MAAKMRAALSAICIGIGIAGVTFVTALGSAAIGKANEIMDMFGTDAVIILGGGAKKRAMGVRERTLTVTDIDGIRQNFPDAYLVIPIRVHPGMLISYRNAKLNSEVQAITTSFVKEWNWPIGAGRDLTPEDNQYSANVCVIGSYVGEILFEGADPIGQQIKIGSSVCEVVGVAIRRSLGAQDDNMNTFVLVPESVFNKKYSWDKSRIWAIRIRFYNTKTIDKQMEEVTAFLRQTHNLQEMEEDDFRVFTPSTISKMFTAVLGAIGAFLGVITLIVVIVGGFVTANMFLLSTQTRVKEIGIRRAFGAGAPDIFLQFIIEFIVITFLGMLVGLAIAWAAAAIVSSYGLIEVKITALVFGITAVVSTFIALIFGTLPARSAAKISPIEAIRSL